MLVCMHVGSVFPGGLLVGFPKVYLERAKSGEICFYHSKLRKRLLCWNFQMPTPSRHPCLCAGKRCVQESVVFAINFSWRKVFFYFLKTRFSRPDILVSVTKIERKYSRFFKKHNSHWTKWFLKQRTCTEHWICSPIPWTVPNSGIISNEQYVVQQLRLIWMSLASRGLTGVIIAPWRTLLHYEEVIMRTFHLLLRNLRNRATIMPARMKANGNSSDERVERFYSVRIKRMMSPSDAADLEPLQ